MTTDIHGPLIAHAPIKTPSNRSFGLTVGGILCALALIGLIKRGELTLMAGVMLGIGTVLVLLGLALPGSLQLANRAWMRLGALMAAIMNPIVLLLVYVVAFVPIGFAMRLTAHDPLRRRRAPPSQSYWIEREAPDATSQSMSNQF